MDLASRSLQDRAAVVAASLSALLALALMDLPYGYYRFLRIAVPLGGIFLVSRLHRDNQILWLLTAVAAVILFNPIYDMEFDEDEWKFVDGLFAITFGTLAVWRLVPQALKMKTLLGASVATVVTFSLVTGLIDTSANWDGSANNITANYVEDPLMGYPSDIYPVDAMNATSPAYEPVEIPSATDDPVRNVVISTETGSNYLDTLFTTPGSAIRTSDKPYATIEDVANAASDSANVAANLVAEGEPD